MTDVALDELLASFRELRRNQKGIDFRHVLFVFVDPNTCDMGAIHKVDLPDEWREIEPLQEYNSRSKDWVMRSLILPYLEGEIIRDSETLPSEERRTLKKSVIDELSSAGRIILSDSNLPEPIQQCRQYALAWLYFIHHILKPPRMVWKRVTQLDSMAYGFGATNWEDLQEVPSDVESWEASGMVGEFSFEAFDRNSYTELRDITTASIDAIIELKSRREHNKKFAQHRQEVRDRFSSRLERKRSRMRVQADPVIIDNDKQPSATDSENDKETIRKRDKSWLAEAMLLINDHPEWSDRQIAQEVKVSPSTLSRDDSYQAAADIARSQGEPKKGYRTTGDDGSSSVDGMHFDQQNY